MDVVLRDLIPAFTTKNLTVRMFRYVGSNDYSIKHSDIYNAALLNYTDDDSLFWRCPHEEAGNCRS
jgi:hypothetical protein